MDARIRCLPSSAVINRDISLAITLPGTAASPIFASPQQVVKANSASGLKKDTKTNIFSVISWLEGAAMSSEMEF
jgi:hypothetical protein